MNKPILEELVLKIRTCVQSEYPSESARDVLKSSFANSALLAEAINEMEQDEVLLHEDTACSVWTCRYDSDVVLPPHEHCMAAHIAVYKGTEVEVLYQQQGDQLIHKSNQHITAGEVLSLDVDTVHAVTAQGSGQSHAIHVYEGPLTQVTRSLFDWTSGRRVPFTMENFHSMKRKKNELTEFA